MNSVVRLVFLHTYVRTRVSFVACITSHAHTHLSLIHIDKIVMLSVVLISDTSTATSCVIHLGLEDHALDS